MEFSNRFEWPNFGGSINSSSRSLEILGGCVKKLKTSKFCFKLFENKHFLYNARN